MSQMTQMIGSETKPQQDRVEFYWALVGEVIAPIWFCRKAWETRTKGEPACVDFDGEWALKREEKFGDIVGFYHTHPGMPASPSSIDLATMKTWVCAFGKPLLCVIKGMDGVRGFVFWNDEDFPEELEVIQEFRKGQIVAVDNCEECPEKENSDGQEISPRRDIPGEGKD